MKMSGSAPGLNDMAKVAISFCYPIMDMGGGTFFKVGGQVHIKKLYKFFCGLNWQL